MTLNFAGTIAILEDCEARIAAMRSSLREVVPSETSIFITDRAPRMVAWLEGHLAHVALISLDHDLPLGSQWGIGEYGDGRIVADYLAALPPMCPVIIHSSNEAAASGMYYALEWAGWPVSRVVPYDGENWIRQTWIEQIQKYIRDGWLAR